MNETLKRIEQDAEDALIEAEGENLNLWPVEENESTRKYWKEVWIAGAISERNKVIDELINLTGPNRRITFTAEYLESFKIPTK